METIISAHIESVVRVEHVEWRTHKIPSARS
jgi:hypothetical protein